MPCPSWPAHGPAARANPSRATPEGLFLPPRWPYVIFMSAARFILLLLLVITAGGATVWIGWAAARAGRLDGQALMAMLPLVMLLSIALRALTGNRD